MDIVFIRALEVRAIIGVLDWERRVPQRLRIDVELGTDTRPAGIADDLEQALDYAAVSQRVRAVAEASAFRLVEALGEALAETLMTEFGVPWVRLTLTKPGAVAGTAGVGITIERGEAPAA